MTKIRSLLKLFYQKLLINKTINKFDKSINFNFLSEGYKLEKDIVNSSIALYQYDTFDDFGMFEHRNIDNKLAIVIMEALTIFENIIIGYIGKDARIDDMKLMWFDPSKAKKTSVSGNWHNDQCGNRLKLYICLKGDGKTPTVFLPNSHTKNFRFGLKDMMRFLGRKNTRNYINEKKLRLSSGDCLIFDTNGMHRGKYESGSSERVTILVEFINKNKSNKISGIAPTGPGNNRSGVINLDKDAYRILSKSILFDHDLLKPSEESFIYSLMNKN